MQWQTWCSTCGVAWVSPEDPGHRCAMCPRCMVAFGEMLDAMDRERAWRAKQKG